MRLLHTLLFASALACAGPATGVDIAWKVLPRRVVADNFGSRVAKLYFGVAVVVGNESGHDLQISSILFELPAAAGLNSPIPADPYRIVRGSLEHEHQVGLRNSGINVIKALEPLLAGGTVFYTGSAYTRILTLFTDPFAKGVEMVFPDKTISQMNNLDNLTMRDMTIIANGAQQVLLVFVSRDLLANSAKQTQLRSRFRGEFEPIAVMRALGSVVLEGKSINYAQRLKITTRPSPQE